MQANPFSILNNGENLSHAYLCYGDFAVCEESFGISLKSLNIKLRSPGHYIFEKDTFSVDDARDLVAWYQTGRTSNDDTHTVVVIAAKVIKRDAQQMLLKILEEARYPYLFFIFAHPGTDIIDTVLSRVQTIKTDSPINKKVESLMKMNVKDRITEISSNVKGMESSDIRVYTEELVREVIINLHNSKDKDLEKIKLFMETQTKLVESHIAPKFILDYVSVIL